MFSWWWLRRPSDLQHIMGMGAWVCVTRCVFISCLSVGEGLSVGSVWRIKESDVCSMFCRGVDCEHLRTFNILWGRVLRGWRRPLCFHKCCGASVGAPMAGGSRRRPRVAPRKNDWGKLLILNNTKC